MTAAPLASPPADPPEHPGLPAPFLALPRPLPPSTLRRNSAGIAVAVLLHGGLLAALSVAVSQFAPPVTPPQASITVSLATPEAPTPEPKPQPKPQPRPKEPTPPKPQPKPAPQARATDKPVITSAPVASNTAATSAAAAPAAPPAPAAPAAAAAPAPVAVVPPRFDAAYLSNPLPPYPSAAKRMGEEGRVLLRVQVGADGKPTDVTVVKSSGFPRLDESARDTVLRSWRFVPARQGDQPVAGAVKVPIDFTLTSAS
jgi:protein TonB